jgi:hypothetical protein
MTLRLRTFKTDPADPGSWGDYAAFRIDQGFRDFNGNGSFDIPASDQFLAGMENFLTVNLPLFTNQGLSEGVHGQNINTALLEEGYHYAEAICFRNRPSNTDPLYTSFRKVFYVDRLPPSVTLADAALPITTPINTFRVLANDKTVNRVHVLINPVGDPLTLTNSSNQAGRYDRFEYRRTVSGLNTGANTVVVVAYEITGNSSVTTYNVTVTVGSGDINRDGVVTIDDLYQGYSQLGGPYDPAADVNADSLFNITDLRLLENLLRPTEVDLMAEPQR